MCLTVKVLEMNEVFAKELKGVHRAGLTDGSAVMQKTDNNASGFPVTQQITSLLTPHFHRMTGEIFSSVPGGTAGPVVSA